MYKKYIRYIGNGPFSVILKFFVAKECSLEEELFSQRLNWQKLARPLSVMNFSTDFVVFSVVAMTTPSD